MTQTIFSLSLEVRPACLAQLRGILDQWREAELNGAEPYAPLRSAVPVLHFMSATVFSDQHYDPLLALEMNFDGEPAIFWRQLEAGYCGTLAAMIRCCKPPSDRTRALFDAAVAVGDGPPVAAYLQAVAKRPIAMHEGHRGLDRARIAQAEALFDAAAILLAQGHCDSASTPRQVHAQLREALLPRFPWLDRPAPSRVAARERLGDVAKLAGAQILLLLTLSLPGMLLGGSEARILLLPLCLTGLAMLVWLASRRSDEACPPDAGAQARAELLLCVRHALPWLTSPILLIAFLVVMTAAYIGVATALVSMPLVLAGEPSRSAVGHAALLVLLGLSSLLATLPAILLWLRCLEIRDPARDAVPKAASPDPDPDLAGEDHIMQTHMASLVLLKPGILRAALARVGLWTIGLTLRAVATDGYLGSMRTIHFAHWTFASNGARLLFCSNFDGSWDSYLDDFIEKAHGGLSLVWGNCIGFPPSRLLMLGGAGHGRRFRAWARQSMAPALLWFRAYPNQTVNQIQRQAKMADGLRRRSLSEKEASIWITTL